MQIRKKHIAFWLCIGFISLAYTYDEFTDQYIPEGWPEPVYNFASNPLEQSKIELGRSLFHEPILSRDSTISCTSCHSQYTAFTHIDHALSHGIDDKIGTRNSPTIMNMAWMKNMMWDGAINHIEVQALAPMSNPDEMDGSIQLTVSRLRDNAYYRTLFKEAYGDTAITGERVLKALSQFMLTMVSANSKYDKVMRHEPGVAFTPQEENGYQLFKQNCASCHAEPLFTNNEFMNNGLPIDTLLQDSGRSRITQNPSDAFKFKVPTLRNIEFSKPYMHDGRFERLFDVINHYTEGIAHTKNLAPQLQQKIELTSNEKIDLLAFLLTLSDKEFLFNPAFSYPKTNYTEGFTK